MVTKYDRYGEPFEDDEQPELHDPRCENGWLGEDDAGRVVPCLQCRPHLARGTR